MLTLWATPFFILGLDMGRMQRNQSTIVCICGARGAERRALVRNAPMRTPADGVEVVSDDGDDDVRTT